MSYNVWFADFYWEKRAHALIKLIETHLPHIFCLQEVQTRFLNILLKSEIIKKNYILSDKSGTTLGSYGVLIGSRLTCKDLSICALPTQMGRSLIRGEFELNDKCKIVVCSSHLESMEQQKD
eukprot:UN27161